MTPPQPIPEPTRVLLSRSAYPRVMHLRQALEDAAHISRVDRPKPILRDASDDKRTFRIHLATELLDTADTVLSRAGLPDKTLGETVIESIAVAAVNELSSDCFLCSQYSLKRWANGPDDTIDIRLTCLASECPEGISKIADASKAGVEFGAW